MPTLFHHPLSFLTPLAYLFLHQLGIKLQGTQWNHCNNNNNNNYTYNYNNYNYNYNNNNNGVTHALFILKPRAYCQSVCTSRFDLSSHTFTLSCSATFALALCQSVNQPNHPALLLRLVLLLRSPLPLHSLLAKLSAMQIAATCLLAQHPPLLTPVSPVLLMPHASRQFLVLTLLSLSLSFYCIGPSVPPSALFVLSATSSIRLFVPLSVRCAVRPSVFPLSFCCAIRPVVLPSNSSVRLF